MILFGFEVLRKNAFVDVQCEHFQCILFVQIEDIFFNLENIFRYFNSSEWSINSTRIHILVIGVIIFKSVKRDSRESTENKGVLIAELVDFIVITFILSRLLLLLLLWQRLSHLLDFGAHSWLDGFSAYDSTLCKFGFHSRVGWWHTIRIKTAYWILNVFVHLIGDIRVFILIMIHNEIT